MKTLRESFCGRTPPPTSMERWAVIQKDNGEIIQAFPGMGTAMGYIAKNGYPKNLKLKKLDP